MRNQIPLFGKVLHTFKMGTRKMQLRRFNERGGRPERRHSHRLGLTIRALPHQESTILSFRIACRILKSQKFANQHKRLFSSESCLHDIENTRVFRIQSSPRRHREHGVTFFLPDPEMAIGQKDAASRALPFAIKGHMRAVDAKAKGHRTQAEALFPCPPLAEPGKDLCSQCPQCLCGESLSSASIVIGIRGKGNKHFAYNNRKFNIRLIPGSQESPQEIHI